MKRRFAALLVPLLLVACGAERGNQEADPPGGELVLEMEHEVYDPSLTWYTYFVRNGTENEVTLGADYDIQYLENSQWRAPPRWDGAAWESVAYRLLPGETRAFTCFFGGDEGERERGSYRLVKEVDGRTLYAEFRIGDSLYTADTPYGFAPLEDLPADYGPGELDAVLTRDGLGNPEALEDFLFKAGAGVPCQLRTVRESGGAVTDVIFENGHFLRRVRSGDTVTERRFSFLVTDGADLYLSNGADWEAGEQYKDERERLIPRGATEEMIASVERDMASRLERESCRYRVWSVDGAWSATLTDQPTEFLMERYFSGGGSAGESHDLLDWDGTETDILGIAWEEDGTLLLNCETLFGGRNRLLRYDPEANDMTSVQGLQSWESIFGSSAEGG